MSICEVPRCECETHAGGLCFKHYMRVRRHGSVTGGRNGDGRVKSAHPQWEAWKSMMRVARRTGGADPAWKDFWRFLKDVGERPVDDSRLYRIDAALPWQPGNVEWKAPILDGLQREDKAAYQRAWRMKRPHLAKSNGLKRNYGITIEDYEVLLAAQGAVCAICKKPESKIDPRSGFPFPLAVDHDHGTGRIRGLLCMKHNRGLGLFDDDVRNLRAAIAYLELYGDIDPLP